MIDIPRNPARKTGRTTRDVTRCLIATASGKRVVYVVHNYAMTQHVRNLARAICGDEGVPKTFDVVSAQSNKYAGIRLDRVIYDHVARGEE